MSDQVQTTTTAAGAATARPDSMEIAVTALRAALPGAKVSTEMPARRPGRAVMVAQVGGTCDEFMDRPRIEMMCWGTSDTDARTLAMDAVLALSDAAEAHPYLSSSEMETISRDEWTQDGSARYRAVVDLVVNL